MRKIILFSALILVFWACGQQTNSEQKSSEQTNSKQAEGSQITDADLKTKLVGDWIFRHEPTVLRFKADGTFDECEIVNPQTMDFGKTPLRTGKWDVRNGKLLGVNENKPDTIIFVNETLLFTTFSVEAMKGMGYNNITDVANAWGYNKRENK